VTTVVVDAVELVLLLSEEKSWEADVTTVVVEIVVVAEEAIVVVAEEMTVVVAVEFS
jgi:hypothetical protein